MSSEDEYANLPDITVGVDLDAIAALCTPAQADASSEYSFDELDDDTLTEVARIEAQALAAVDTATAAGNTRRSSFSLSDARIESSSSCLPPPAKGTTRETPAQPAVPAVQKAQSRDAGEQCVRRVLQLGRGVGGSKVVHTIPTHRLAFLCTVLTRADLSLISLQVIH